MKDIIVWKCSKCKEVKPVNEFSKNSSCKKGFRSRCKACQANGDRDYYNKNYDKIIVRNAKYRGGYRPRRRYSPEALRRRGLKKKYNLTVEQYESMLAAQNECCAICGQKTDGVLHVDHDHKTGKVRGLLCRYCNQGIGFLQDNVSVLEKAIKYLLRF
jgi:hypothetical protein